MSHAPDGCAADTRSLLMEGYSVVTLLTEPPSSFQVCPGEHHTGFQLLLCSKAATALWKDVCQAYNDKDLKALTKSTTDLLQLLEDLDDLLASHEYAHLSLAVLLAMPANGEVHCLPHVKFPGRLCHQAHKSPARDADR